MFNILPLNFYTQASGFSIGLLNNDSVIINLLELGAVKTAVIGENLATGDWISVRVNIRGSQLLIQGKIVYCYLSELCPFCDTVES